MERYCPLKLRELQNELSGMNMLSPLLPCQLTSQFSGKYKVAAGPFAYVQAFRLRSILMRAELYKQCSLKYSPLSSLPKTLTLFSLTRQPHAGAAAQGYTGGLETTWIHSSLSGFPLYLHTCLWFYKEVTKSL